MIYLDNAATSFPKPHKVVEKMSEAMLKYSANAGRGGHKLSLQAAYEIFSVREKLAAYFGISEPNRVIFTANATMSLNMAIYGIMEYGNHCIISELEHNSVWRVVANLNYCSYSVFKVYDNDEETLEGIRRLIKPNTKCIITTAASNVTGDILPIEKICRLAKRNNVLSIIDASQATGFMDLKADKIGYDMLASAGHKGLYGPQGTGILIINTDYPIKPIMFGGTGTNSAESTMPNSLPERLECGTLNLPGIVGLGAGVDFVSTNEELRVARELELRKLCKTELENIGATLYGKQKRFTPTIAFHIDGYSSQDIEKLLDNNSICVRSGMHCAPLAHNSLNSPKDGLVRVSIGAFNKRDDIYQLIYVLKNI